MKLKQLLKKIYLLPFSILMAVPDGGGAETSSGDTTGAVDTSDANDLSGLSPLNQRIMSYVGEPDATIHIVPKKDSETSTGKDAETSGQGAGLDGNPGEDGIDNGLDTASEEDDQGAGLGDEDDEITDDSTQLETEESEEGTKGKGKKTLKERVEEIKYDLEKQMNAKLEAELAKIRATETATKEPQFAPPDVIKAVQMEIIKKRSKMRELESELDLEGDDADPQKAAEFLRLDEYITDATAALRADANARKAWEHEKATREQEEKQRTESSDKIRKELDRVAEVYRADKKIDPVTWNKMGAWFQGQIDSKPLLVEEFNNVFSKHGEVAAIRFAHEYTVKNMGQKTKATNQAKETHKDKTAQVTSATASGKAPVIDLAKAYKEFAEADDHIEAFAKLQAQKRMANGG